jgi:hypothetical protein
MLNQNLTAITPCLPSHELIRHHVTQPTCTALATHIIIYDAYYRVLIAVGALIHRGLEVSLDLCIGRKDADSGADGCATPGDEVSKACWTRWAAI